MSTIQLNPNHSSLLLRAFVEETFIPIRGVGWSDATADHNRDRLERYIYPMLGNLPISSISPVNIATLYSFWAKRCKYNTVFPLRILVRSIFKMAHNQGFIHTNPAADIRMPRCQPTEKPVVSLEHLNSLLDNIDFMYRVLLEVAFFAAPVSGELFALRWRRLEGNILHVRDTVYKGRLQLNTTKNEARSADVVLPDVVVRRLGLWRKLLVRRRGAAAVSPDALIFPSRSNTPLQMRNVWRAIQPVAQEVGIEHNISMQLLRRSFATHAQRHGSIKDISTHLRHASIRTTADIYVQTPGEAAREMVENLYSSMRAAA